MFLCPPFSASLLFLCLIYKKLGVSPNDWIKISLLLIWYQSFSRNYWFIHFKYLTTPTKLPGDIIQCNKYSSKAYWRHWKYQNKQDTVELPVSEVSRHFWHSVLRPGIEWCWNCGGNVDEPRRQCFVQPGRARRVYLEWLSLRKT